MNDRRIVRSACSLLLVCGLALGCGRKPDMPHRDGDQSNEPAAAVEATEVRAEVVAKDSQNDPLAPDAKYKGKTLVVEGPVKRLYRRPVADAGVVVLVTVGAVPSQAQSEASIFFCECRPEDEARAMQLSPGQIVRLHGSCVEVALGLRNCVIDSAGPDPAVRVSAAELVAEFLKEPKATEAKYKGRLLTLTDAVVEKKFGVATSGRLVLAGDPNKSVTVVAKWPEAGAADWRLFDAVKPGDRVTIKGHFVQPALFAMGLEECCLVP